MGKYAVLLVLLVVASADLLRCYAHEPVSDTVKGGMDQAAEKVKASAEQAKEGAEEAMHDAKETTSSWADWAADKISHGFGFNQQQTEETPGPKMESAKPAAGGN